GGDTRRPPARATDLAAHRRHALHERDQLGDVVAVAAGDRPGERDAGRVYEQVLLGAVSGPVNRARARRGAPFFACTWLAPAAGPPPTTAPGRRPAGSARRLRPDCGCRFAERSCRSVLETRQAAAASAAPSCAAARSFCAVCRRRPREPSTISLLGRAAVPRY